MYNGAEMKTNDCINTNCSLYGKCNLGDNCQFYNGTKKKENKYHAEKCEYNGEVFDSRKEMDRYIQLKLLERCGQVSNIRRQVKYELIPAQREEDKIGKRGGVLKGNVIEKSVVYRADFVYTDRNGDEIVEDVKGIRTKEYILKRKLMLYVHGIRVKEI